MTIEKVIAKIREIEESNDQSITFTLHEDGSGSFEDFWNGTTVVAFNNQQKLAKILNECSSVAEEKEKSFRCFREEFDGKKRCEEQCVICAKNDK